WLRERHIADVCASGAESGELVVLDASTVLVRYRFASREAFTAYERDHAPRLRAEGIAQLAGAPALFTRTTGEIVYAATRSK
ncbi:MAG TPA: hypothetical protein VIF62_36585, partial [Labilithrix sp.]